MTSRPNIRTNGRGTFSVCFSSHDVTFCRTFSPARIKGDPEELAIYLAESIAKALADAPKGQDRDTLLHLRNALVTRPGRPRATAPVVTAKEARAEIDKAFRSLKPKRRHE